MKKRKGWRAYQVETSDGDRMNCGMSTPVAGYGLTEILLGHFLRSDLTDVGEGSPVGRIEAHDELGC